MSRRTIFLIITGLIIAGLVITVLGAGISKVNITARTGAGYTAKVLCSEVFLGNRSIDEVRANEFAGIHPMLKNLSVRKNASTRSISVSLYGFGKTTAYFTPGTGCTLGKPAHPEFATQLTRLNAEINPAPWPQALGAQQRHPRVDYAALSALFNAAGEDRIVNNRALLVAVDGQLVGEWYTDGFDKTSPFLSWSAAKSITATLIGIGAHQGWLDVTDPIPVPEWQNDPDRKSLTWDHLLRMSSGLDFKEDYGKPASDVNRMLFQARSAAKVAVASRAKLTPGTQFYYSSGTSNILARTITDVANTHGADNVADWPRFIHTAFLKPLGLKHTTLELDADGDFIGSSYAYATARDWLRMGQFYLQDGIWNGERLFPENWVQYITRITPTSNNHYGAHFWLNNRGEKDPETGQAGSKPFPALPENAYFFAGRDGQYVIIVPDKTMVIARFGLTRTDDVLKTIAPTIDALYQTVSLPSPPARQE